MPQNQSRNARLERDDQAGRLICSGDWSLAGIDGLEQQLLAVALPDRPWQLDASRIECLDTTGALVLQQLRERLTGDAPVDGLSERNGALLQLVEQYLHREHKTPPRKHGPLTALGMRTREVLDGGLAYLDFVGRLAMDTAPRLLHPTRLRWKQVVGEVQHAGVHALPILGLLAFLTGVVIAYQGGIALRQYGADIFIVDLVTITMLREMAPLITAIIVAGRTGSAYTAQIGTMQITEEVDALRTLGITPLEILALPKLLALLIAMPLLTVFADLLGMLGGIAVAQSLFNVGIADFLSIVPDAVDASNFWVGIAKAPVFAVIIMTVSCHHGFAVQGSTESVGRATTRSVVQSIFLVILADAAFSIIFDVVGL